MELIGQTSQRGGRFSRGVRGAGIDRGRGRSGRIRNNSGDRVGHHAEDPEIAVLEAFLPVFFADPGATGLGGEGEREDVLLAVAVIDVRADGIGIHPGKNVSEGVRRDAEIQTLGGVGELDQVLTRGVIEAEGGPGEGPRCKAVGWSGFFLKPVGAEHHLAAVAGGKHLIDVASDAEDGGADTDPVDQVGRTLQLVNFTGQGAELDFHGGKDFQRGGCLGEGRRSRDERGEDHAR